MAKRFKVGKVVIWTNDGEVVAYDSVQEAYEKVSTKLSKKEFIKALGTDQEVASGITAFRYGIDIDATKAFDDAADEMEEYEKEQEAETW
ncbi:MAG: hypothetical protein GXX85_05295 [Ignavibacteria bacterium]|nr:hypothetical protein [Ignavibacteria bacterium]